MFVISLTTHFFVWWLSVCWCLFCKGILFYGSGKERIKLSWHPGPTLRCPRALGPWCGQRDGNNFIKHQYLLNPCLFITKPVAFPGWQAQPGHSQLSERWGVCPKPRHCTAPMDLLPSSCFLFLHPGNKCGPWEMPWCKQQIQIREEISFSFLEIIS